MLGDASTRSDHGAARNDGAGVAASALIAFCDADDVVSDTWLGEMREALRAHTFVAGMNDYLRLHSRLSLAVSRSVDSLITMPYWPQFTAAGAGNLGITAAAFAAVGGFDEALMAGEDVDLCWRVQLKGHELVRCESVVVFVRKRRGLAAVYRQAYGYEVGNQLLRAKYAALIDEYWRQPAAPTLTRPPRIGIVRTMLHMARRLRPNGLADTAWGLGEWIADRRLPAQSRIKEHERPSG